MPIPFIDLSRSVDQIKKDVLSDWAKCLDNCEFVGGPTVKLLEERLEKRLDIANFITCGSGTDALIIGLQALGIKPALQF